MILLGGALSARVVPATERLPRQGISSSGRPPRVRLADRPSSHRTKGRPAPPRVALAPARRHDRPVSASTAPAAPPVARHRARFVAAAVAGGVAIPIVALVVWQWLWGMVELRGSQAYAEAVERARAHPRLVETLGEPVEPGWWVRGDADAGGTSGRTRLVVPLAGPGGRARLDAEARRQGDVWRFDRLEVTLADGEVVDLLAAPAPSTGVGETAASAAAPPGPAPPAPWHVPGIERRS